MNTCPISNKLYITSKQGFHWKNLIQWLQMNITFEKECSIHFGYKL